MSETTDPTIGSLRIRQPQQREPETDALLRSPHEYQWRRPLSHPAPLGDRPANSADTFIQLHSRIGNRAFGVLLARPDLSRLRPTTLLDLQRTVGGLGLRQLRETAPRSVQRDRDPAAVENEAMAKIGGLTEANFLTAVSTDDLQGRTYAELNMLLVRVEQILVQTPADMPLHAPLRAYWAAVQAAHEKKLAAIFESFGKEPAVKEIFSEKVSARQRAEFMETMRVHLGSYEAVEEHFKRIRAVRFAGNLALHDVTATRLEAVNDKLTGQGLTMPATTVGFGLRGRFLAHSREPLGHPLGYAIDYHAVENPHVKDPRLWRLLEMETNRGSSFKLAHGYDDYRTRRRMLERIGSITAETAPDDAKVRDEFNKYLTSYLSEYKRVKAASREFGENLSSGARERIAAVYQMMRVEKDTLPRVEKQLKKALATSGRLEKQLARATARMQAENESRARRNKSPRQPTREYRSLEDKRREAAGKVLALTMKRTTLQAAVSTGKAQRVNIEADFPDLFAPWLKDVEAKKEAILQQYPELTDLPQDPKGVARETARHKSVATTQLKRAKTQNTKAQKESEKLTRQVDKLEKQLARTKDADRAERLQTELARTVAKLALSRVSAQMSAATLERAKADEERLSRLPGARQNFENYSKLEQALRGDFEFVFGSGHESHRDPPVAQLMDVGLFTPQENAPDDKRREKLAGFTEPFMKLMAEHGFDHGANWQPGGVDPMHFELAQGLNALPGKEARGKGLGAVERKLAEINRIRKTLTRGPSTESTAAPEVTPGVIRE